MYGPPEPRIVAHVVLSLNVGGLERMLLRLLERIDRARYAPIVVALDEPGALSSELRALDIPLDVVRRRPGIDPHVMWEMAAYVRRERVAIVHTHNATPHLYGAVAALIARWPARPRPRVVHTKHGRNAPGLRRKVLLNGIASALSDRVVAVGEDTRGVIVRVERVSPAKVITIPNGIDLDEYRPGGDRALARARLGIPEAGLCVGCVARLSPEKDHATLLRAFAELRRRRPDARLALIGDGPTRAALVSLAAELGVAGAVVFAGTRSDVAELLAGLDVFAQSSLTEGLSLTLLEASAAGLPIVATRVGGNAEVVADGETGLLVPPSDPRAFADALVAVAERADRVTMGARGRARVALRFDAAEMARRYERLYDEVLGIARGPYPRASTA